MERWQAELVGLAVYAVLGAWPAYKALTAGRPGRVREWARLQNLPVTGENEQLLSSYLRRSRRWRVAGAVGGLVAGDVVPRPDAGGVLTFALLIVGYLLGVVAGELAEAKPVGGDRRRASLSPRRLEQYVPAVAVRWVMWGAVDCVAVGALFLVLPRDDSFIRPAEVVITAVGAVAFAGATRLLATRLLQRPQPPGTALALATDDVIRSSGVRAVVGAGAAGVMVALAAQLWALGTSEVQVLRWTMWVASLVCFALALGSWRTLVDPENWPIRRRQGPATSATS